MGFELDFKEVLGIQELIADGQNLRVVLNCFGESPFLKSFVVEEFGIVTLILMRGWIDGENSIF